MQDLVESFDDVEDDADKNAAPTTSGQSKLEEARSIFSARKPPCTDSASLAPVH
jgi:hypothetical protein